MGVIPFPLSIFDNMSSKDLLNSLCNDVILELVCLRTRILIFVRIRRINGQSVEHLNFQGQGLYGLRQGFI